MTPTARRAKSFDDNAWKNQHDDESLNLSSNISAVSSVALSSGRHGHRSIDSDPSSSITGNAVSCGGGLDDILVIESGESDDHHYSHCGTLSRGEVRKSRSKMKSYLKRCKEALIGSQSSEDTCPITHHEAVVQHQQQQLQQPPAVQIPTANWYLDDQLCEIRPEDNREPYSTFASARLKEQLESEEQKQKLQQQLGHENSAGTTTTTTPPEPGVQSQDDDPLDSVNESGAAGGLVAQGSEVSLPFSMFHFCFISRARAVLGENEPRSVRIDSEDRNRA